MATGIRLLRLLSAGVTDIHFCSPFFLVVAVVVVSLHWSFYYACLYVSCTLKIYVFYRIPLPHRWLHYFRLINFQLRVEQYETGTIV